MKPSPTIQANALRLCTWLALPGLMSIKLHATIRFAFITLIIFGVNDLSAADAQNKNLNVDILTAGLCDKASLEASRLTGVPVDLLFAISRTETGRTRHASTEPWPWTVNMEGRGLWFDTKAEAMSYVFDHFKTGARSFDIGCFQINYRWHGAMFQSIEEMFDPTLNAKYAASFLNKLFNESGEWRAAAGAFHSRTPNLADRYLVKFDDIVERANLPSGQSNRLNQVSDKYSKHNHFPLLRSGPTSGLASLVPLQSVEHTGNSLFSQYEQRQ